jgi:RNA polymerase sigma-70 factor (ECF subfamily)
MLEISGKHRDESDEDLLKRYLRSGDLDLLGDLYARYMHLVYGVSLKYLESRDDASDAVMHIFEKLITEIQRHQVRNFKSWLYVLTKNHCLMELRSRKQIQEKVAEIKTEFQFMESAGELHPIDRADYSMEDKLRECIGQLKEQQRACIEMFYYQNQCYREIASELQIEEKKVKSHIQNGKRNLKICLENSNVSK